MIELEEASTKYFILLNSKYTCLFGILSNLGGKPAHAGHHCLIKMETWVPNQAVRNIISSAQSCSLHAMIAGRVFVFSGGSLASVP